METSWYLEEQQFKNQAQKDFSKIYVLNEEKIITKGANKSFAVALWDGLIIRRSQFTRLHLLTLDASHNKE